MKKSFLDFACIARSKAASYRAYDKAERQSETGESMELFQVIFGTPH